MEVLGAKCLAVWVKYMLPSMKFFVFGTEYFVLGSKYLVSVHKLQNVAVLHITTQAGDWMCVGNFLTMARQCNGNVEIRSK